MHGTITKYNQKNGRYRNYAQRTKTTANKKNIQPISLNHNIRIPTALLYIHTITVLVTDETIINTISEDTSINEDINRIDTTMDTTTINNMNIKMNSTGININKIIILKQHQIHHHHLTNTKKNINGGAR